MVVSAGETNSEERIIWSCLPLRVRVIENKRVKMAGNAYLFNSECFVFALHSEMANNGRQYIFRNGLYFQFSNTAFAISLRVFPEA